MSLIAVSLYFNHIHEMRLRTHRHATNGELQPPPCTLSAGNQMFDLDIISELSTAAPDCSQCPYARVAQTYDSNFRGMTRLLTL